MLARAVQNHDSTNHSSNQSKVSSVAKQLMPSSSFNAGGGHSRQSTLKPSSPTFLNSARDSSTKSNTNPLKRSASQADSVAATHYPPRNSAMPKQSNANHTSGLINRLHNDVFFDENDFEDDDDLVLDNEGPNSVLYPRLPTASTSSLDDHSLSRQPNVSLSYPKLPVQSAVPSTKVAAPEKAAGISSAPIQWSSSPPSHKEPPPNAALLRRPSLKEEVSHDDKVLSGAASATRPTKRRTLPWLKKEEVGEIARGSSAQQGTAERHENTKPKNGGIELGEPYTPLPKNSAGTSHPWNKSASAIKEEQKVHRQAKANQGKKITKQIDADKLVDKKKSRDKKIAPVFLSDEQKRVLDLVVENQESVFFTGSAGTGKSVLMKEIIEALKKKYRREPDRIAVTASTGLAACHIGGVTLHSFAGIGLGKENPEELVKKIGRNPKAKNRWMRTKFLIIDEISMVDGVLFDKLEQIARSIRKNGRPFGGIKLVLTGDFFQLPPVPDYGREATFAFDAATWLTSIEHTIGLTQVFRQRDPTFANMLNEMRIGKLSRESINAFSKLNRKLDFVDDIEATELFPTRNEVENANNTRMALLGGRSHTYHAHDSGSITDVAQRDKLLSNCMAPPAITLKKGTLVMLVKNLDDTLVNGSKGTVIAFMNERTYDHYIEDEDSFLPLEAVDAENESVIAMRERLTSMHGKENPASTSQLWPLVRFKLQNGTSRDLLCLRESWKIELPNGEVQAQRNQIPLILAWALSIHKAQGQTLHRVKVDLGKIFEKGQAYVALSRATTQEGLQITRFDPKKVMAHEKVRQFYNSLYSVRQAGSSSREPPTLGRSGTIGSRAEEKLAVEDFVDEQALAEAYG